jgi:hypothetical protein
MQLLNSFLNFFSDEIVVARPDRQDSDSNLIVCNVYASLEAFRDVCVNPKFGPYFEYAEIRSAAESPDATLEDLARGFCSSYDPANLIKKIRGVAFEHSFALLYNARDEVFNIFLDRLIPKLRKRKPPGNPDWNRSRAFVYGSLEEYESVSEHEEGARSYRDYRRPLVRAGEHLSDLDTEPPGRDIMVVVPGEEGSQFAGLFGECKISEFRAIRSMKSYLRCTDFFVFVDPCNDPKLQYCCVENQRIEKVAMRDAHPCWGPASTRALDLMGEVLQEIGAEGRPSYYRNGVLSDCRDFLMSMRGRSLSDIVIAMRYLLESLNIPLFRERSLRFPFTPPRIGGLMVA